MLKYLKTKIGKRTKIKRITFFLITDIVLISLSCYLGFFFRFDGSIPAEYFLTTKWFIVLTVPTIIFLFYLQGLYSIAWSFISIKELLKLFRAVLVGFLVIGAVLFILKDLPVFRGFPRFIIFISGFLVFLTTGIFRFAKRIYLHGYEKNLPPNSKKVLIFGAGDAGEELVRHITTSPHVAYFPIGFIDDDPMKQGVAIHGVRILGKKEDIPEVIKKYNVDELIIAMPSAPQEIVRQAVNLARSAKLQEIKILPSTKEILEGRVTLNNVRDISIEDLLGRDTVDIDTNAIQNFISNRRILVTGAAGSIGSYLCREILNFSPEELIAFDRDETSVFHLERNLNKQSSQIPKSFSIGDICDQQKVEQLFNKFKPDIIFHAAAYKHVPLMEFHPDQAVRNNIFGLRVVAETALKYGAERFVFISTDKAVNPSSVMGMTKRIGEMICQAFNQKNHTKFMSVRFGNVLDSRGNVISVFKEQIKRGGPVEVTHPEMKRYFMVTSEAVLLVMQAGAMGEGGEVFVLDMGEPVMILDLAKEMIKLSGFEPDKDIPIVFTKIRPGEKLFENILTAEEGTLATQNQKIFMARLSGVDERELTESLERLKDIAKNYSQKEIVNSLKMLTSYSITK